MITLNLAATNTVKRNSTAETWRYQLTNSGAPVDLSSAGDVLIIFRNEATGVCWERLATVQSGVDGWVTYQPVPADVAVTGKHLLEFVVAFGSTAHRSPMTAYVRLSIIADLQSAGQLPVAVPDDEWRVKNGQLQFIFPDGLWYTFRRSIQDGIPTSGWSEFGEA